MNIPLILIGIAVGAILVYAGISGFSLKEINLGALKFEKNQATSDNNRSMDDKTQSKFIEQVHHGDGDNIAGDKIVAVVTPPDRDMTEEVSSFISSKLPDSKDIRILLGAIVTESEEPARFSSEVKQLLINLGYNNITEYDFLGNTSEPLSIWMDDEGALNILVGKQSKVNE